MTSRARLWWASLAAVYLLAGAFAFAPGLGAGFVSDIFTFLEIVRGASWRDAGAWFVPVGAAFYRPVYRVTLWAVYQVLGMDPLGYHLIAWLAHALSALALAALTLSATRDRIAAGVAGFAFLWSIHAHEVVYDVASLHHALGGTLLLATVLAWARGRRALSVVTAAVGLLVNELALTALVTLCWYELCLGTPARVREAARWLLAHAALVAGYFVLRLALAQADLPSEGRTCLGLRCLAVAAAEYANRLLVRPEALIAHVWSRRVVMALASITSAGAVVALLRPWAWRGYRPAMFGAGWTVIGVAYVVLALWPYVSDRFLYVADMGLGLLLGCLAGEGVRAARESSGRWRALPALALVVIAMWIALGGPMLRYRGALWAGAGSEAERIVAAIHAAVPAPPAGALLCVHDVPDSYATTVAPGNTGPYVFRNSLSSALRIRYDRSDLRVAKHCSNGYADIWLGGGRVTARIVNPP